MSLRDALRRAQLSGWSFLTSAGADEGIAQVALSQGFMDVQTTPPLRPVQARLSYASVGGGHGISAPGSASISVPEMFSTGTIYSLAHRYLAVEDFGGATLTLSISGQAAAVLGLLDTRMLGGGGASLVFFGGGAAVSIAASLFRTARMIPMLGIATAIPAAIVDHYFWTSFKGVVATAGASLGVGTIAGFAIQQGWMHPQATGTGE